MNAQRVIKMVATAALAYYFGYGAILFLDALGSAMGGMAGVPSSSQVAITAWWEARHPAMVTGFVFAAAATAIHLWIARRHGDRKWVANVALVTLVVVTQPFLQFTLLQRTMLNRFNTGDASAAAALPDLGMNEQLPAVVARLRTGGPDSFQVAVAIMNFSGGPGELRVIALDRTAPAAARFSAALALAGGPDDAMEVRGVIEEVTRESDTNFRVSVPRRLKAAQFRLDPERVRAIRRELMLDASPRVRIAALEGDEWPAGCDLMPALLDDPVAEVRSLAFANLRRCHSGEPDSDAVRSERIAIYRKLLDHPELAIRIGSGDALAQLGDASGTAAALKFIKGDPYGKDDKLLVMAIDTVRRNLGEQAAPMLWTISQCDRAMIPRGHYGEARHAASSGLDRLYGYGKWPPQYQPNGPSAAPMLPEFCVTVD